MAENEFEKHLFKLINNAVLVKKMLSAKTIIFIAAIAVCYAAPKIQKIASKRLGLSGGVDAKSGQFPFQASIQMCPAGKCQHICGGVIINEKWILTGASCANVAEKVVVGSINLRADTEDTQTIDISAKFLHPGADESGVGPNDVGLIRLKTPVSFNTNVQTATLPTKDQVLSGTANASGYGYFPQSDTNNLQGVLDLDIVSFEDCNKHIQNIIDDEDTPLDRASNICTLGNESNNCVGDLGSPLSQNGIVIGTVTWYLQPCGLTGAPNVYTNVATFVDWINGIIDHNN